jgi:hypothetical protein
MISVWQLWLLVPRRSFMVTLCEIHQIAEPHIPFLFPIFALWCMSLLPFSHPRGDQPVISVFLFSFVPPSQQLRCERVAPLTGNAREKANSLDTNPNTS